MENNMKKTKLFVMVHDGTFTGDSAFYCPGLEVPYVDGMTLRDLKKAYAAKLRAEDDWDEQSAKDDVANIKGAWILDQDGMDILNEMVDSLDPVNDSDTYACNRACKRMSQRLCVGRIGSKVK